MEVGYSSPRVPGQEFDVYFSFSEKHETRYIAEYSSKALVMRGIRTFIDGTQVLRGSQLGRDRRVSIQASRVAILFLSEDYLSSDFCMEELSVILQCREELGMIVVPVFANVNPSDLRKCRGVAEAALKRQRLGSYWWRRWKNALQQSSDLCGWDRQFQPSDSKFVGLIVDDIVDKNIPSNLKISVQPIGYDACFEYLNLFLQMGSNEVLVVGIGGQSQMGKTMIAKAIYHGIFHAFDGGSFIREVGLKSKKPNGLVSLQQQLISNVLSGEKINISSVPSGVNELKQKLRHKRVLIVLDDVSNLDQLYALVGSREWFGKGSKIIITTRILPLLRIFGVDHIFMTHGLPLPLDIIEIWEPYQQSCCQVAGLKGYIESLHYLTNEKAKYLEACLRRERRKNEIQAKRIIEFKQGQKDEIPSKSTTVVGQNDDLVTTKSAGTTI